MFGRLLDSLIGQVSPTWGMKRMLARATMSQISAMGGGGGQGGYASAKNNRFTKLRSKSHRNENSQPRGDINWLRAQSWELWRLNPQARKICRKLKTSVIGRGMRPMPTAALPTGEPHSQFRMAAKKLWERKGSTLDYLGKPGEGGQTITGLAHTALQSVILSGEVLVRRRNTDSGLRIQLISPDRLSEQLPADELGEGNLLFAGIELTPEDKRAAYHLMKFQAADPRLQLLQQNISRVPVNELSHIYVTEDVDQLRGVPWFAAALGKMQDVGDYEYNELKAAAVAACVVLGYRRSSGQNSWGVSPPDDWDLMDADGNKMTTMQPGMLLDLGRNGEIQGFNPQRPNADAAEFIGHMLRSQAVAVPGVKGSCLTGDYRRSSFSSERAADNDTWPELDILQDWFGSVFYQPIYEALIIEEVINGTTFQGLVNGPDELLARRDELLGAAWQGPVAKSISPSEDAKAARERIRNGQSTPQREATKEGTDWSENIHQIGEFIDECVEAGLPESYIAQALGIDQQDQPLMEQGDASTDTDNQDSGDTEDVEDQ